MSTASSQDLHPRHGGRFVLTRADQSTGPAEYHVEVFLPAGKRLEARLRWSDEGAQLAPELDDPWAHAETLKLARVLRQSARARLSRWRARPT